MSHSPLLIVSSHSHGDIFMFSRSPQDHIDQVRYVLRLLYRAGVTLKLKRYKFFAEVIDHSGQFIRPVCVELAEHSTDTVTKLDHRTAQTER